MNKECVSVIVPCYNEEATIVELLNSVLKQEMIYEIIVIDDGSTDKSVELIKGIGSPKIKVELNSTNLGKGKTVNRGLNLAAGQFVMNMKI